MKSILIILKSISLVINAKAFCININGSKYKLNDYSKPKNNVLSILYLTKPGAEVISGTEKYNDAIEKFSINGEWKKSLILIQNMREKNLSPSIESYCETISSMRKALEVF
mmetsp:Transcript_12169/g.18186  ORF Transcript_12169/g.18186 Transcript_12169/m.18186 type:complete len:111 (-) Transcript_12169:931-1263(-)